MKINPNTGAMSFGLSASVAYEPMTMALVATAASTVIGTAGALVSGAQQKEAYEFEAKQAEMRANEARAAGQRKMFESRKKEELTLSRLRAVASATSGKATDIGTLNQAQDIGERGEYIAMLDWAQGESRGRGFEDQAAAARYKGKMAQTGSYFKAAGTLFDGIGSFARGGSRTPPLGLGGTP